MATYEVWLTSDAGVRLAQLSTFQNLAATRTTGKPGWFSLRMPRSFNTNLILPDKLVQIWRAPKGGRLGLWRVYFLRKWTFETQGSDEILTLEGPDVLDLLRRRIVAAYAGSAQAEKTDYADDMMKAVVTESISDAYAPTPTAGTRVWANLSIQNDLGLGPTITKGFAYERLLNNSGQGVLGNLAQASREAGTEVFFDIVPNVVNSNSITFQFQTFIGQPGQDVTDRVVFDQQRGNMKNPKLIYDYSDEENYIYAGGQGEGSARNIQQIYDTARYGASIWNRCEGFADARNQATDNGVREAGRATLEPGRPKINFTATPVDTDGTRFGRDWDFGYKARARYRNVEFDTIIRAVTISVDEKGIEQIQAKLEFQS